MTALDTGEAQPAVASERRREQDRALSIAVLGRKGGSGKSTTAFNLAGSFVHRGLRCLLIDFDSQASISALFFADVKRNVIQPDQATRNQMTTQSIGARLVDVALGIEDLIRPIGPGLDILPGDRSIESVSDALKDNPTGPHRLRRLLQGRTAQYDVVIIDTMPTLGYSQLSAMFAGDVAVVPTRLADHDTNALGSLLALRDEQVEYGFHPAPVVAIVPADYKGEESHQRTRLARLRETYGELVTAPIPHSALIDRAFNDGIPAPITSPETPVARAYQLLADRLLPREVSS